MCHRSWGFGSKYLKMHEKLHSEVVFLRIVLNSFQKSSVVSVGMQQPEVRLKQEGTSWPRAGQSGVKA